MHHGEPAESDQTKEGKEEEMPRRSSHPVNNGGPQAHAGERTTMERQAPEAKPNSISWALPLVRCLRPPAGGGAPRLRRFFFLALRALASRTAAVPSGPPIAGLLPSFPALSAWSPCLAVARPLVRGRPIWMRSCADSKSDNQQHPHHHQQPRATRRPRRHNRLHHPRPPLRPLRLLPPPRLC